MLSGLDILLVYKVVMLAWFVGFIGTLTSVGSMEVM